MKNRRIGFRGKCRGIDSSDIRGRNYPDTAFGAVGLVERSAKDAGVEYSM